MKLRIEFFEKIIFNFFQKYSDSKWIITDKSYNNYDYEIMIVYFITIICLLLIFLRMLE